MTVLCVCAAEYCVQICSCSIKEFLSLLVEACAKTIPRSVPRNSVTQPRNLVLISRSNKLKQHWAKKSKSASDLYQPGFCL